MRLIGSKIEQDYREILNKSHYELYNDIRYQHVLKSLKTNFPDLITAYFLKHIPEQGEDIYTLLIDLDSIVMIEVDRYKHEKKATIELESILEFSKTLTKSEKIKLAVAIDLAGHDIQQCSK